MSSLRQHNCWPISGIMSPDFYPLSEHPVLGEIPQFMLAQTIRESRFGEPKTAFQIEKIPVPELGPGDVLVYVMAAGVNYNNIWAALGMPVNVIKSRNKKGELEDFHIGGSDASGIVWKVGQEVNKVKVGDEVTIHCGCWDSDDPHILAGKDPALAPSQNIWGYESNYGAFAQFSRVQEHQCLAKPQHLSWEEAAVYMLGGATAYRMLHGWPGNTLQYGDPVLIWGGAGGVGSMAIQIAKVAGARSVAVVSSPQKFEYCLSLGAVGVINRKDFNHWGTMPRWQDQVQYNAWLREVTRFGQAFWEALGEKRNPAIVLEHPGEETIPTSMFVCDAAGMVVICAGTSGYNATLDLRYHRMPQKRFQGSHFANDQQCVAINQLVAEKKVDPCLSRVFHFGETAEAHQLMHENEHPPGNMAILVNAPQRGMTTL